MKLFAGVDGGGTRTRVAVVDGSGRLVGRGESGLANLHHAPQAQVLGHLLEAFQSALARSGAPLSDVVSVFFGMAGVTCDATASKFRQLSVDLGLGLAKVGVDHDIRIALAGGLAGRPGIALIVGTGSSCYGRDASGRTWQSGGWGSLVSDEGSGYDLGRQSMVAAVRMSDGRLAPGPLREEVFSFLGVSAVREVLARLYEQGIERNEIASLAPRVVALAEQGEAAARGILENGARELARMVSANHRQLPTGSPPQVVITGGLGTAPTLYRRLILEAIAGEIPRVQLPDAEFEPVLGATLIALEQAGVTVDRAVLQTLATSSR